MTSELQVLKKMGCDIELKSSSIELNANKKMKPVKIKTGPFPNFATDNMPMLMAVLTKVEGKSEILETIFSNRYMAAGRIGKDGSINKH